MEFLETWGVIALLVVFGGVLIWRVVMHSNASTKKVAAGTNRQQQEAEVNRLLGSRGGDGKPSLTVISRSDPSDAALPDDRQLDAEVHNVLKQLPKH